MGSVLRRSVSTGGHLFDGMREESPVLFARMVLLAIGKHSASSSPFLHATHDLELARRFKKKARTAGETTTTYLERIRRSMLSESCILDMSTKQAQDSAR